MSRLTFLIILFFSIYFLSGQDELEALVTWEVDCGNNFICENFNKEGSDLNNDGYDDYIIRLPYGSNGLNRYQIFLGSATPESTFDFEIEVPDGSGLVSWGGDLNSDGYKDITFAVVTDFSDPGVIYICYGGEEIDLEPEFILVADDYVPYSYGLNYKAFNGGFDFNGDGNHDLLTWAPGPDMYRNGLVQIFLGGQDFDTEPDFQIWGGECDAVGDHRAVGDINGDGFDDLVLTRRTGVGGNGRLELYLGSEVLDTVPDFISDESFSAYLVSVADYANGDINNDGFDDYLFMGVGIFLGNPEGILNLDYPIVNNMKYININGDEYDDVLFNDYYSVSLCYGSADFDLEPELTITGNYQYCSIGDFNNDGKDELLNNDGANAEPIPSATLYTLSAGNAQEEWIIDTEQWSISNYPNPFNPTTTIKFSIPEDEQVELNIFNIKGERVRELKIENVKCKINSIIWDGKDENGQFCSSGIYLMMLKQDGVNKQSGKLILMK